MDGHGLSKRTYYIEKKMYRLEVKSRNDGFKIIIIIYQLIMVKGLNYDCVENEFKKLVKKVNWWKVNRGDETLKVSLETIVHSETE